MYFPNYILIFSIKILLLIDGEDGLQINYSGNLIYKLKIRFLTDSIIPKLKEDQIINNQSKCNNWNGNLPMMQYGLKDKIYFPT